MYVILYELIPKFVTKQGIKYEVVCPKTTF